MCPLICETTWFTSDLGIVSKKILFKRLLTKEKIVAYVPEWITLTWWGGLIDQ
jgi:hypothetical protein